MKEELITNQADIDYEFLEGLSETDDKRIWLRSKGESPRNYRIFLNYLMLGAARTRKQLYELYKKELKPRSLQNLSAKWSWEKRARAYDNHTNELLRVEYEAKVEDTICKQVDNSIARIRINDKNAKEIDEDQSLNSQQRAYALESSSRSYHRELESLFMLSGRPEKTIMMKSLSMHVETTPEDLDKKLKHKFQDIRKKLRENSDSDDFQVIDGRCNH